MITYIVFCVKHNINILGFLMCLIFIGCESLKVGIASLHHITRVFELQGGEDMVAR